MPHAATVEEIVAHGYCAGCGLCKSIAEPGQIEMVTVAPGRVRPAVRTPLGRNTQARIAAVCPGITVEGNAKTLEPNYPGVVDAAVGPTIRCFNGYATDEEIRYRAAAGGGLTALGLYLVETGKVDYVLHVTASERAPMRSHQHVSFDRTQLLKGAGSRYGPLAPLVDVRQRLDQGQRFAFIGKPCDINAMRNLAKVDARVDELVPYMLTISCGGLIDYVYFEAFLARHGLREEQLEEFRYRGYGWPGPHYARTSDGREAEESYLELLYDHPNSTQFRCKVCPDSTGEQADVSVMDPWPDGVPERNEEEGWCLFQTRTSAGDRLVADAAEAGYLHLEAAPTSDVRYTQPHQVRKKSGLFARLFALWLKGVPLPKYRRMRLLRAALEMHPLFHWRNFRGATRRLLEGGNRETMPAADSVADDHNGRKEQ